MSRSSDKQLDWLFDKLSNGKYTKQELREEWKQDTTKPISERSISRWIRDLKLNLGLQDKTIEIEENTRGQYYIVGKSDPEKWVAVSTKMNDLLTLYKDIKDKILIDVIPSENKFLEDILYAIKNNLVIKFDYKKYSDKDPRNPEIKKREFHPYCVKRFENRWYVTGFCVKSGKDKVNDMRTFSLDMIVKLKLTDKKFPPDPSFNAVEYFKNVYGITTGDNKDETDIVIKVDANRAVYLHNLPLHPSQKEIGEKNLYPQFQYKLCPAEDFYQALLHHGEHLTVLYPDSVRDEMKRKIQKMAAKYKICKDYENILCEDCKDKICKYCKDKICKDCKDILR